MGMLEDAARRARSRAMVPPPVIRSSNRMRPSTWRLKRETWPVKAFIFRAFPMETNSRFGLAGLGIKSAAPACITLTMISIPLCAVSTMRVGPGAGI